MASVAMPLLAAVVGPSTAQASLSDGGRVNGERVVYDGEVAGGKRAREGAFEADRIC